MNSPLIDCHLHLQDVRYGGSLPQVLSRARESGIKHFVVNGSEECDWTAVKKLSQEHDGIIPCFGLHPWYIATRSENWLGNLEASLSNIPSAVGEIGLDRLKEPRNEALQEEVFRAQLEMARKLDRPACIHSLKAWGWILEVLKSEAALPRGFLIHAYSGSAELITPLLDLGAYISFAGNALFEKRTKVHKALRKVPLDRILIETDSPDILPPPRYRKHTAQTAEGEELNEPANLAEMLLGFAELRGEDAQRLAENVFRNASRLFEGIGGIVAI